MTSAPLGHKGWEEDLPKSTHLHLSIAVEDKGLTTEESISLIFHSCWDKARVAPLNSLSTSACCQLLSPNWFFSGRNKAVCSAKIHWRKGIQCYPTESEGHQNIKQHSSNVTAKYIYTHKVLFTFFNNHSLDLCSAARVWFPIIFTEHS